MKKKVPVSIRAVIERINQKLAAKGHILMATRKMKMTQHFGDYFIFDLSGNVIDMDVDPEKLARKLRLLKEGDEVERRELRQKTRPQR